jgi:hypothetical protein
MSFFCYGIYFASKQGFLLNPIAEFTKRFGWLNKPLFGCFYCMASLWGSVAYTLIQLATKHPFNVYEWLTCIVCCVAMNVLVYIYLEN